MVIGTAHTYQGITDYVRERLIHHQFSSDSAEGGFEAIGVHTWFAQVAAMNNQMMFAGFVAAFFMAHFFAFAIEEAEDYICFLRKAEVDERHFNEWIWGVLVQFHTGFVRHYALWHLKTCSSHELYIVAGR